ncbi:MAG TPA: VWA domain-containing protein [Planctomycetota bacterium]|nr:VWA domain-containing protein [Planctomycetota bacterium]
MIDAFRFQSPLCFLLLIPALAAMYRLWLAPRKHAAVFSSLADLKSLPVTFAQRVKRWLPFGYGLGIILLIGALARPQMGRSESIIRTEGIAIQIALDISGSMEAIDFELDGQAVNRLKAVQHVITEFVKGSNKSDLPGRKNDAIGLVAFGGFADSKCPLTLDHGALTDMINELKVPKPIRDRRGRVINMQSLQEELATAIGDGLALSIERLKNANAKSKVLILLTDGDNNAGVIQPMDAAKLAQTLGIKVYTIGVGRTGVAQIPREDEFGQMYLDRAMFRIDEALLKEIAATTGGKYYNASNTQALREVYADIDRLEKSKVEETRYTEYTELYPYMALPGMALLLAVALLWQTRFLTVP